MTLNHVQTQYQLAVRAYTKGNYERADQLCSQLLTGIKSNVDLLNLKAMSCLALGQTEVAETTILKALKLKPDTAGMHLNAALVYQVDSRFRLVKRHALKAVQLAPRETKVLYQAAVLCRNCADYSRALRIIERCLQVDPGVSDAWQLKGSIHTDLGEFQAATPAFEKAVSLQPFNARALSVLIDIRRDGLAEKNVLVQLENIRKSAPSMLDRATATFSLAGMYRRESLYGEAFKLYRQANELVSAANPFDLRGWEQRMEKTMAETSPFIPSHDDADGRLIFIVGMPRSGTSLCEQVLGSHPDILACGELAAMAQIESSLQRRGINPYDQDDAQLPSSLQDAASRYLAALPKKHGRYQWVIDKDPMNFERIGLIHRMFPTARFVYCKRNPLDTILSCYFQDFRSGLNFPAELGAITRIYIRHIQLMQHWSKRLPRMIHTVNYASLVRNLEHEARAMTDFLNCDFNPAMMRPHEQKRAVTTASNLQVREPVYATSIDNWKHYRPQLEEVITLLQQHDL